MTPEEIKKKAAELQAAEGSPMPTGKTPPAQKADTVVDSSGYAGQKVDNSKPKQKKGFVEAPEKSLGKNTPPKDKSADLSVQQKEENDFISTIYFGDGINLMPLLSDEEKVLEEKKLNFNYFGAFVLLFLAILALVLIGLKAYYQSELTHEKASLLEKENEFRGKSDVIHSNNSILRRVDLYQSIEAATFSPKEVLLYWQELFGKFGEIDKIELTSGLNFQISGSANNLTEVSRLWHLLSVDKRVARVTLGSVDTAYLDSDNTVKKASYTFEGELDFNYFSSEALRPQ